MLTRCGAYLAGLLLAAASLPTLGQTPRATPADSLRGGPDPTPPGWVRRHLPVLAPAALIAAGALTTHPVQLVESDEELREEIQEVQTSWGRPQTRIDDYLRYAPAYASLGLSTLGIKGQHGTAEQAILFALTYHLDHGLVSNLKRMTRVRRPDGSNASSFPSQHTSMAFATATLLHKEYGGLSPWYSVGGYAVAAGTGTLRLLKDKHWLSDVLAGAGVGIASTELTYLVYPVLRRATLSVVRKVLPGRAAGPGAGRTAVLPFYAGGAVGATVVLVR